MDAGELGGLKVTGLWLEHSVQTVSSASVACCLDQWSHLQLLQSRSGECPTAQAKSWQPGIGPLGLAIGVGQAQVLRFISSLFCFPGPVAVCAEPALGRPPARLMATVSSGYSLHPHCLGDLQLLPVPRGEGAVRFVRSLGLHLHFSCTLPPSQGNGPR